MAFSFNNGGMISTVYFLCLIFCVGEANFIDDLLGSLGNIKSSGSTDQTKPRPAIEANWKWTASPAPSAPPSGLGIFYVTQYGAKADGTSESSKVSLIAVVALT